MAVTPLKAPQGQQQFFGALMVGSLILVGCAVFLTERPVWMNGEEPSFGVLRPFSEAPPPPPVYTPEQLRKMATAGLPEGGGEGGDAGKDGEKKDGGLRVVKGGSTLAATDGPPDEVEGPAGDVEGVPESAQVAGGTVHKDDRYVGVENAPGPKYPKTHGGQDLDVIQFGDYPVDTGIHTSKRLRGQDTIVPTQDVEMAAYPLLGLQDSQGVSDHDGGGGRPVTANALFARALASNGLGDGKHIETVAGGLGANSEPPLDRIYDAVEGSSAERRVDDGSASVAALWIMGALVFCGAVVLLGYNMLPEGSFSSLWGALTGKEGGAGGVVEHDEPGWERARYDEGGGGYGAAMRDMA